MSPDAPASPAATPARLQTCVECGNEVPLLIGGSCPDCFVGKAALLEGPEVLDVELCAHCDARHVGNHWVDPDEGMPLEWIREEAARAVLKPHPNVSDRDLQLVETAQDERNFRHHATLTGSVEGVPITFEKDLIVRMRRSVCDRCSRMFGGYYAALIQLRATDRDVTELEIKRAHRIVGDELDRQRASGNRESFLTKSGAVPGGFDYYLGDIEGTRGVARLLAERLGATYEEHAKLSGRKEGEDIYRVTFLVRVRLFAPGDFGLVGDDPVQFKSMSRGRAFVVRLSNGGTDKVDEETLKRLGGPEILKEAVVVSQDAAHVQLLDPVSLRTVDVPRPPDYVPEATAWVLRHEERLYLPALPVALPQPKGGSKSAPAFKNR
ncbi:MAG TPA: 60S ribosomal export protein NMD3 [Candidatus Thermoplasmatota archaeon]|nr:60S ribosomal export protein NMD3 [Candidatus Thermoplasmatota archaeon]